MKLLCSPTNYLISTIRLTKSVEFMFRGLSSDKTTGSSAKNGPAKAKTPIGKLDELEVGKHPFQEKEPLAPHSDGVNRITGEVGGPRGPEPTRFGDWERKGRVTDF